MRRWGAGVSAPGAPGRAAGDRAALDGEGGGGSMWLQKKGAYNLIRSGEGRLVG